MRSVTTFLALTALIVAVIVIDLWLLLRGRRFQRCPTCGGTVRDDVCQDCARRVER